ncbi:hypothetical protein ES705_47392 [subsurface metagenome]
MAVKEKVSLIWLAPLMAVAISIVVTPAARAAIIPLGTSGWQASWDASLDPYVSITVDSETSEAVYITKTAEFTQPPGPGGFKTIPIQFQQTSSTAVSLIGRPNKDNR